MDDVLALALEEPIDALSKHPFSSGGVEVARHEERVAN